MSWQAFREADQKASDDMARRELERARRGEPLFSADKPSLQDYIVKNLERQAVLKTQRANPGSVVRVQGGKSVVTSPSGQTIDHSKALAENEGLGAFVGGMRGAAGNTWIWVGVVLVVLVAGLVWWRARK